MLFTLFKLSIHSLRNRMLTVGLTLFAIALGVFLLLGVEKVRTEAKQSFTNTVSGTDLVVGARSGSIQLLLYSIFRLGNPTSNVSWKSYRMIEGSKDIAWTIPISLGDSHRGFRVLGTTEDYFQYYRFGRRQALQFKSGKRFEDVFDAVLGADVAKKLGYRIGQKIILSHGIGDTGGLEHDDKPFQISGILSKTGTPLDRTIHVSLNGMEAIHIDWRRGAPIPGMQISAAEVRQLELEPKSITAFLLGLKSKLSIFKVQRRINQYRKEPLMAILPGVALQELWDLMSVAEIALAVISVLVVVISLLVMLAMLLSSLNDRRREMAILRSVGARVSHIFLLLIIEAGLITFFGMLIGLSMFYAVLFSLHPFLETQFGLFFAFDLLSIREFKILLLIFIAGLFTGLLPAYRACKKSIAEGLIVRL